MIGLNRIPVDIPQQWINYRLHGSIFNFNSKSEIIFFLIKAFVFFIYRKTTFVYWTTHNLGFFFFLPLKCQKLCYKHNHSGTLANNQTIWLCHIKCQKVDCITLNTPQKLSHLLFTRINLSHLQFLFCLLHFRSESVNFLKMVCTARVWF